MKLSLFLNHTGLYHQLFQSFLRENGYDPQLISKPRRTSGVCFVDEFNLSEALDTLSEEARVIIIAALVGPKEIWLVKKFSLHGIISPAMTQTQTLRAITENLEGRSYFPPEILKLLIQSDFFDIGEQLQTITAQEKRVIQFTAIGKSNMEIAELLKVSQRTVNAHKSNLLSKTGFHSMENLIAHAITYGIISSGMDEISI